MAQKYYCIIALLLFSTSLSYAQTTEGKEFWVTFGRVGPFPMVPAGVNSFDMRIRIVSGKETTSGTIYFTNLEDSVNFNMDPYEIYTHILNNTEKYAVYNETTGTTNFSIRITASNPVSVFASNRFGDNFSDVTNILPVTALGRKYYAISYKSATNHSDAYAVVATLNNTYLYHNGDSVATLAAGEVYYRASTLNSDMTGDYISANNPVAFFALSTMTAIPINSSNGNILFQQLAPANTWGKTFFVPVTAIGIEYVRIVAAQDSTTITQVGGTIRTDAGGQPTLDNLQSGQFVELEILLSNNGCSISADKPVGVCSFMKPGTSLGACSQVWIPPIEQSISNVLMASFTFQPNWLDHYALVLTSTVRRNKTMVSIGENTPVPLSDNGGIWHTHTEEGMSFCNFPLTNDTTTYMFSNPEGIIVLGYAINNFGFPSSYYYLAGSAMRDLDAAFYANDIHFQDLEENPICENEVSFRAEIENTGVEMDSIKWYIDDTEYETARDSLEWNKTFTTGEYEIRMWIRFENDDTISKIGILKIANCEAVFYANGVHYENLPDTVFCAKDVYFHAEIENYTEIKWFIDGTEYEAARDLLEWDKPFATGTYNIEMWVLFANGAETVPPLSSILRMEILWIKIRNIRTQ